MKEGLSLQILAAILKLRDGGGGFSKPDKRVKVAQFALSKRVSLLLLKWWYLSIPFADFNRTEP